MPTVIPPDIRHEVDRMREVLQAAVGRSLLSASEIEQMAALGGGELEVLFAGRVELRVAHVFRILRAIGIDPSSFFLQLCAAAQGTHDAA